MFRDDLTKDITKFIFIYKDIRYVIDKYTILDTPVKNRITEWDTRTSDGTYTSQISSHSITLHLKPLEHLTDIANELYNKILGESKDIPIFQNDDNKTYHAIVDQDEDLVTTISISHVDLDRDTDKLIIII